MSTASLSLSQSGTYRAASLKQVWVDRLVAARTTVWNALLAYGNLRAEAEVLRTARQFEASRPELARELRRVAAGLANTR
jgi:hypothetical protein